MNRPRIKDKIAALRAKTKAAGCTEAEALAAAELAAKLMADHGLSEADMVMTDAAAAEHTSSATWRTTLASAIAYCTNTAAISLEDSRIKGSVILFTGRAPGPEIAVYLRDVCIRAVITEAAEFRNTPFYRRRRKLATKRQASADFIDGLVERISARLLELFRPTLDHAARQEAKTALQVRFKGGVAHVPRERKQRYSEAASAGWVAGGKVALNHGVETETRTALPASRSERSE